ncbi:MAG: zf-HC2 domain-containing protein [Candidatus Zixiibacteriota bacterium]|nr:MAG: zf-HC2 domain-containing protein [candidate division Zixibacteria bacterium]
MSGEKCTDKDLGALKHAYELGALTGEEAERFEVHLLSCPECFEEVRKMEAESFLLRTDMSVRREVRQAVDRTAPGPSLARRLFTYLWPETPLVFRPAVALIAFALLIYPAYLGVRGPDDVGIREIQSITLVPTRSSTDQVLKARTGHDGLIAFVYPGAMVGKEYHLTVESEDGTALMSTETFTGFDRYETGRIVIPLGQLKKGTYRLTVKDPRGMEPYREQVYVFLIDQ